MLNLFFVKLLSSILIGAIITLMLTTFYFINPHSTVKTILKKSIISIMLITVLCYIIFEMLL